MSWDLAGAAVGAVIGLASAPVATILAERSPLRAADRERFTLSSRCTACRAPVSGFDLVPVVSMLGRRCRACGTPIPWTEPLVEVLTIVVGAVTGARMRGLGVAWTAVTALVLLAVVLVPVSIFDLRTRSIATRVVYPASLVVGALLVAAALAGDGGRSQALRVVACGLGASAFIWLLFFIAPGGMGDGDARLALLLGLGLGWFGWRHAMFGLFAGFAIGAAVGVVWAVVSRRGLKAAIPFGPWLALGAWVVLLLADRVATGLA